MSNNILELDGVNDYIKTDGFQWPTGGPVTVEFWSKVNTVDVRSSSLFTVGSQNDPHRFQAHTPWGDRRLYWDYGYCGGAGRVSVDYTPYLDKWTHVALVSKGNGGDFMGIYLNGKLVASTQRSDGPDIPLTDLWLGKWDVVNHHKGKISEFRIWNKVRTISEIQETMLKSLSGNENGLVGYWSLTDGTTKDYSSFKNDAITYGSPAFITEDIPNFNYASNKPNILFIVADDLGADIVKFIDNEAIAQAPGTKKYKLPNLSKLLQSGVNFTRTWAHPVCSPTRATMFTGMHPWQNEVGFASFVLNPPVGAPIHPPVASLPERPDTAVYEIPLTYEGQAIETYADTLKAAGYTCGFFGKWDQGYMLTKTGQTERDKNGPIARGWDRFEGLMGGGVDPRASATQDLDPRLYWTWVKEFQDVSLPNEQRYYRSHVTDAVDFNYPMTLTNDAKKEPIKRAHAYATADSIYSARDWIVENAGKPWCTTLALHTPHYPYHVPPAGTFTIDEFIDTPENLNKIGNSALEEQAKFVAMVESLDYYLGELFNDPNIQEELKKTVIVFVGDNGTPSSVIDLDNDPIKEGKRSIYMPGVNVPMLLADGGALATGNPFYLDKDDLGADSFALVQVADLFQTFTDMGKGVRKSNYELDAFSLVPYLTGENSDAPTRQYNFGQYFVNIARTGPVTDRASITDGEYKLNYQGTGVDIQKAYPSYDLAEHHVYEFAELMVNPETGLQFERYLNDFTHPKAIALHKALTDSYYANNKPLAGSNTPTVFPPLPASRPLSYVVANQTAIQQQGKLALIKPDMLKVGGPKDTRGKMVFDLSNAPKSIKKATLYLKSFDLEITTVGVEPLLNATELYTDTAVDSSKLIATQMSGDARYDYDVTEIVQGWINNPASNFGFRIKSTDNDPKQEAAFYNHNNIVFGPSLALELDIESLLTSLNNKTIRLKSQKGDYLHRLDSDQGVTTSNTGNEWIVECLDDNKISLKSFIGDCLHRPDSAQGITTWNAGIGNTWSVEFITDKKIRLKSWKNDYLNRSESTQGVDTTLNVGINSEWIIEEK